MKKKIVSLAIAGMVSAPAFADSMGTMGNDTKVTFYGVLDNALQNVTGSGLQSQTLVESGGPNTSYFGVKASHDLGNGLKAIGDLEYGIDLTNAANIGGSGTGWREKMVGLTSDTMGTVQTGWLPSTAYAFSMKFDPFAQGGADPMGAMVGGGGFLIGWNGGANHGDHALAYTSPNMSGFTVDVNYQTASELNNFGASSAAPVGNTTGTLLSGSYDNGPLSLEAVYAATSSQNGTGLGNNTVNNQTEYALGASYDFTVAKLYGTWQQGHRPNAVAAPGITAPTANNSVVNLSATIPAGSGTVAVGYARTSIATANGVDGSAYALSYGYPLSKHATLYTAAERVTNGSAGNNYSVVDSLVGAGNLTAGGSSTLMALGMAYSF